jgi:hypothetical protein
MTAINPSVLTERRTLCTKRSRVRHGQFVTRGADASYGVMLHGALKTIIRYPFTRSFNGRGAVSIRGHIYLRQTHPSVRLRLVSDLFQEGAQYLAEARAG